MLRICLALFARYLALSFRPQDIVQMVQTCVLKLNIRAIQISSKCSYVHFIKYFLCLSHRGMFMDSLINAFYPWNYKCVYYREKGQRKTPIYLKKEFHIIFWRFNLVICFLMADEIWGLGVSLGAIEGYFCSEVTGKREHKEIYS